MDQSEEPIVKKEELNVNEVADNTFSNEPNEDAITICYSRPKFSRRVLANLLDFIVFVLLFFACFLAARGVVNTTPGYKSAFNSVVNMRLESGLYVKEKGNLVDIVSYMKNDSSYTDNAIVIKSENVTQQFFTFEEPLVSENRLIEIKTKYDELRLEKTTSDGVHLFVLDEGEIVKNQTLYDTTKSPFVSFYYNYLDKYLQGYLTTTPKYYDAIKTMSNYLLWVEIPIAFFLSLILTYFVPSLIFVRGRSTLGKALYRIGTVDSRYLSPTFWRNLAKWGIFTLEFIAGIASLGLIFILSFSMMAFSKKRQGFPDYMLGLQEVDMSKNKVFKSLEEAKVDTINSYKKATDFRLRNYD